MLNQRAQSQIISTVLLILLVIVGIAIISSFAVNFIRDKLSGEDCLEVFDKVKIGAKYTCYDSGSMRVQIQIGDINTTISGFKVELGGADSRTVTIVEGGTEVSMYDDTTYPAVVLPGNNEARTYVIEGVSKPDSISVYPVLSDGKVCEATDILNIIADCGTSS